MTTINIKNTNEYMTSLHDSIRQGNFKDVEDILSRNCDDKHCYNDENESAAATALKNKQIEIYELLISRGLYIGLHEDMQVIARDLSRDMKLKIRDAHKKYSTDLILSHLRKLYARSKLHQPNFFTHSRKDFNAIISQVFEVLNAIEWIEPILQTVAYAEDLFILFDFESNSVEKMDPTQNKQTLGFCYHSRGDVYIGAKGFLDEELYADALGVMIHELCHYAMNLTYDNKCEPYVESDEVRKQEFDKVLALCEVNKEEEPEIEVLNKYPKEQKNAELIVRVPHMLAMYKNDSTKLQHCKETFCELFDFFERKTLQDLKRQVPMLEARQKLNEQCGVLSVLKGSNNFLIPKDFKVDISTETCQILLTNCPQVTINAIYYQHKDIANFNAQFLFVKFKDVVITETFDLMLKARNYLTNPKLIIDCDDQEFPEIVKVAQKLQNQNVSKRVVLVVNDSISLERSETLPFETKTLEVKHYWGQFTDQYQMEFLERKISFQGKNMQLKNVVDKDSIMMFDTIPLKELIEQQKLSIGKEVKFSEIEIFIPRNFLCQRSDKSTEKSTINPGSIDSIMFLDTIHTKEFIDKQKLFLGKEIEIPEVKFSFAESIKYSEQNVEEIVKGLTGSETIILSAEPGVGKSTAMKKFAELTKAIYPFKWTVFLDLKLYCNYYDLDQTFDDVTKVVKFFTEKILQLDSFESNVFKCFYKDNRVIFLMDGFDEVCPRYEQFLISLMNEIQQTSMNQLCISIRPHLEKDLHKSLKFKELRTFTLKVFSGSDINSFFKQFFQNETNDDLYWKKISNCRSLTNYLSVQFTVSNPLILYMIAKLFNEKVSEISVDNIYAIYDKFTSEMIFRSMQKGPEVQKILSKSIGRSQTFEFYQKKALEAFINSRRSFKKVAKHVINNCFINDLSTATLDHDFIRTGLMYSIGSSFYFIHQTFAEFFVAQFIYEQIFLPKLKSEEGLSAVKAIFKRITCDKYFSFIAKFLNAALSTCYNDPKILKSIEDIGFEDFRTHINNFVRFGHLNLIKAFSHFEPVKKFWLQKYKRNSNVLMTSIEYQTLGFIEDFYALCKDLLDSTELKEMFLEANNDKQNIFHLASSRSTEIFDFCIDQAFSLFAGDHVTNKLIKLFVAKDKHGRHVCELHQTFKPKQNIFEILENKMSKTCFKALLITLGSDIFRCIENPKYIYDLITKFVTKPNECLNFFRPTGNNKEPILQCAARCFPKENFEGLWNLICSTLSEDNQTEILMQEFNNFTVFHCAMLCYYGGTFHFVNTLYQQKFGQEKIKEILDSQVNGKNILMYVIESRTIAEEGSKPCGLSIELSSKPVNSKSLVRINKKREPILIYVARRYPKDVAEVFYELAKPLLHDGSWRKEHLDCIHGLAFGYSLIRDDKLLELFWGHACNEENIKSYINFGLIDEID